MNSKILYIALAGLVVAGTACHKKNKDRATPKTEDFASPPEDIIGDDTKPHGWQGVIKDMRSLDGCQWIIQLDIGVKIQPKNLADFTVVPADGKRVMVDYTEVKNAMGTCMSGKIVKISGIWELP